MSATGAAGGGSVAEIASGPNVRDSLDTRGRAWDRNGCEVSPRPRSSFVRAAHDHEPPPPSRLQYGKLVCVSRA
eukprot:4809823-Prymnesium_polylepis.1